MNLNPARRILAIGVCLAAPIALIACGSSNNSTSTEAATTSTIGSASGGSGTEVALADSGLGQILVAKGLTVYLFEKDDSADESYCSGDCAKAWPPLTTKGTPQAGNGVDASKLTTFTRDDGTTQVAYNGHPLYYYAGDSAPGDTNGNELDQFGAEWYAMTAAGESVGSGDSSSGETTTSDSSGGYSY